MKFTTRADQDPRGLAFWVRVRLQRDDGRPDTNAFIVDLANRLHERGLGVEGGEFGGWHWQLLVSADEPGASTTEDDREYVRGWIADRQDIADSELGPLTTADLELALVADERRQAEIRWLGAETDADD